MMDNGRRMAADLEQKLRLCIMTYFNLYGVMPSTKEMCAQLGDTNEIAVADYLHRFSLPSLQATA